MAEWVEKALSSSWASRTHEGAWGYRKDLGPCVEATALACLGLLGCERWANHDSSGPGGRSRGRMAHDPAECGRLPGGQSPITRAGMGDAPRHARSGKPWGSTQTGGARRPGGCSVAEGKRPRRDPTFRIDRRSRPDAGRLAVGRRDRTRGSSPRRWPCSPSPGGPGRPSAGRGGVEADPRPGPAARRLELRQQGGLRPAPAAQPGPTGLALAGARGRRHEIRPRDRRPRRSATSLGPCRSVRAPVSLGWGVLGLRAWDAARRRRALAGRSYAAHAGRPDAAPRLGTAPAGRRRSRGPELLGARAT